MTSGHGRRNVNGYPMLVGMLFLSLWSARSDAYELGTHARITRTAVRTSPDLLSVLQLDLGLAGAGSTLLGNYFFDLREGPSLPAITRRTFPFESEESRMPGPLVLNAGEWNHFDATRDVTGWLLRGTIREDDGSRLLTDNPHDVDDFNRFCNHFYDPKFNTRFNSVLCAGDDVAPSPAWAAGVHASVTGAINRPLALSPTDRLRKNHYSLQDAREAMWRALTLKQFRVEGSAVVTDPSPDGVGVSLRDLPEPTEQLGLAEGSDERANFSGEIVTARRQYRDAYWATTFFALGSLLHLNQDMAQPQHTRIEAHPFGPRGDYERYAEMRAKSDEIGDSFRSLADGLLSPVPARPLSYSNADSRYVPALPNFSDFWSTAATGDVKRGSGLGDHSNSRFFSQGHNLGQGRYSSPSNNPADYVAVERPGASGEKHRYLVGAVTDPWSQSVNNILMTRLAPNAEFRARRGLTTSANVANRLDYMLDSRVYDDYLSLLIPTAVRYSQGLLKWFFRGRLAITAPDEELYGLVDHAAEHSAALGHGFSKLKAKVADASAGADSVGQGYLVGVARFHRSTCADLMATINAEQAYACRSSDEEITVSKPIVVSGLARSPTQYTFEFPAKIPISATDLKFQVVFRGQLGDEPDAVIVGGKDLYEPTFFTLRSDRDYISVGENVYRRDDLEAQGMAGLLRVVPQSCVIYSRDQPPRLSSSCFRDDTDTSMVIQVGTRPAQIEVRGLPLRQYSRIAYLSDSASTVFRRTEGSCRFPGNQNGVEVRNVKYQANFLDYVGGRFEFTSPAYASSRGVPGWHSVGCLWWADIAGPTTDQWWSQMTPLASDLRPTPVTRIDF